MSMVNTERINRRSCEKSAVSRALAKQLKFGKRERVMAGRGAVLRIILGLSVCLSMTTLCGGTASAAGCPNELRREAQNSTYLPDCRAYEMVSPLDKNGADVSGEDETTQSSADGESVAYAALAGFGDSNGSGSGGYTQYIATRHEGSGWTSHGITPLPATESYQFVVGATAVLGFSEDMSHALVEGYSLPGATGGAPKEINYYDETTATNSLQAITTPLTQMPLELFGLVGMLRGFSPELNVVTFESVDDLLPQTTGSEPKLYEWNNGTLQVAGVLPDGTLPSGGSGGAASETAFYSIVPNIGTVSRDGSRIAFMSPVDGPGQPQLYLRRDGTSTAWVSESEASTPDPEPHDVRYQMMGPDGTKVLFTSSDQLLDSDPGGEGVGLYMYTDGPSPQTEANLAFLGRIAPGRGKSVVAMSENGSRVYFATGPTPEFPQGGTYLWDEGTIHFVAPTSIAPGEEDAPSGEGSAQASADGRQLAFLATEDLTAEAGESTNVKMYVYNENDEALRCVSCSTSGVPASSNAELEPHATFPPVGLALPLKPRFMSSDGQYVFFSTADPLVARDTNGLYDAYEYDTQTGELSLLSSGTGENGAWFAASSTNGKDVFIVTRERLTGTDTDTLVDLYDVRVGGGFPEPSPQAGGCVGDECQGTPSAAPSFNTASGFSGLGNIAAPVSKAKPLTRAQKLARALKACKPKPKQARKRCEAQAKKKYRPKKVSKSTSKRAGR